MFIFTDVEIVKLVMISSLFRKLKQTLLHINSLNLFLIKYNFEIEFD